MFAYPKQAEFNRVVPKSKIYARACAVDTSTPADLPRRAKISTGSV